VLSTVRVEKLSDAALWFLHGGPRQAKPIFSAPKLLMKPPGTPIMKGT
jgi:hypothetical protein